MASSAGNLLAKSMANYATCYGGYQFCNWAVNYVMVALLI